MLYVFVLTGALAAQVPAVQPTALRPAAPPAVSDCAQATSSAGAATCHAEQEARLADAASHDPAERTRHLERAAAQYRRAAQLTSATAAKTRALNALVGLYDRQHLHDVARIEEVVRELLTLAPNDYTPVYKLARLQEDNGLIDAAETTLLDARRQQPDSVDPYRMLAQFYARRATALVADKRATEPAPSPGEPDANGVYRVGGPMEAPHRADVPEYPKEAAAAGIEGVVLAEIVIDEQGHVADARIVRSIPMLDEAALKAVREWRFNPTVVNGRLVPVRMTVNVNFTTRK